MIQVQEEEWVRRTAHNLEDLIQASRSKTRTKQQNLFISHHLETAMGLAVGFCPCQTLQSPEENVIPTQEHSWGGTHSGIVCSVQPVRNDGT